MKDVWPFPGNAWCSRASEIGRIGLKSVVSVLCLILEYPGHGDLAPANTIFYIVSSSSPTHTFSIIFLTIMAAHPY